MLKGKDKKDYQKDYMRKRRSNKKGLTVEEVVVRPKNGMKSVIERYDPSMVTKALSGYRQPNWR